MSSSDRIKPSERAFNLVRQLARKAAKTDHWMEICLEDVDLRSDPGEIGCRHREQWEETCHWERFYGNEITLIVDTQERRLSPHEPLEFEQRYYGLCQPLVDAFWDEWEDKVGLWAAIENAINPPGKRLAAAGPLIQL